MKKILIFALTICAIFSLSGALTVYADTSVSSTIVAPSTYLEFCELDSPIDYAYNEATNTHVICEAKRIICYKDDLFSSHEMPSYNITEIKFFADDFVLFLSDGKLYYIHLPTFTIGETGFVANYFDVLDNLVVTAVGNSFKVIQITPSATTLTANEKSHYNVEKNYTALAFTSPSEWLCVNEGTLFKFNSTGNGSFTTIANNLKDTRYACYSDGVYYLSRPNGVFYVDVATGATYLLKGTETEQKLGNIISPQGITFYDGKIFVTDFYLNAVSSFDPKTKEFTGFAITSRSEGAGRVSAYTNDLQTYGETIYALDRNAVKIFDGTKTSMKTLPLAGTYTAFSVIDDKMLVTNGNTMYALNLNYGSELAPTLISVEADLSSFTSVTAITYFADNFYFLNNTIIDSNPYAEVYSLSALDFKTIKKIATIQGRGDDLCADIFGKLYVQMYRNAQSAVMTLNVGDTEVKEIYNISNDSDKILSIATDFECNVYALQENNKIVRIDENLGTQAFTISLSPNLPPLSTAKDLAIIPATDKMYALFNGFILKLNPADLMVASPAQIAVPNDYLNTLNENLFSCTLKPQTRYFEVDLANTTGEYFCYTGYSTYLGSESFVILHTADKYTLIANDNLSCIVRTSDIESQNLTQDGVGTTMYLCFDAKLYSYPVLTPYFRIFEVKENESVKVHSTFTFNGTKFALCESGDKKGYVPFTMLKTAVAMTDTPLSYQSLYVGRFGANVYSDKELTSFVGTIDAFDKVKVYEYIDNVCLIEYNGEMCYIEASNIVPKGKIVIRNFVLCSIALIAIIVTVIFIYRRKYVKKSKE